MSDQELSGVDLARVALRAAVEAARKNGERAAKAKSRTRSASTVVRRDGREPIGLGDAIGMLVTERAWELPTAGASLRDRWAAIVPEFAGHVAAVGYEADSGRLTVCPESSAWATKLRLEQARVIDAANLAAARTVVRSLQILAPGSVPVAKPADLSSPAAAAPVSPVKTRGYRRALEAFPREALPRRDDAAITQAAERQSRALRELSKRAFGEDDQTVDAARATPIVDAQAERRRTAAAVHATALRRARKERAERANTAATT
ncbi:DciA family protein [Streptomyces sp. NPDC046994]|uniref:DciA family protein n=1 Tax=Streptomyces sp. NPDC046994 TaxID=3155735 RepID=UPI00345111C2